MLKTKFTIGRTADEKIRFITEISKTALDFKHWCNDNIDKVALGLKSKDPLNDKRGIYDDELDYASKKVFCEPSIGGFIQNYAYNTDNLDDTDTEKLKNVIKLFSDDESINDVDEATNDIICFGQIFKFMWNCSEWYEYVGLDLNVNHPRKYMNDKEKGPHVYEIQFSRKNNMKIKLYDAIVAKYYKNE